MRERERDGGRRSKRWREDAENRGEESEKILDCDWWKGAINVQELDMYDAQI